MSPAIERSSQVRTTLHLDSDVYQVARSLAAAKEQGLGSVVSALARKGLHASDQPSRTRRGFPTFAVAADARRITTEMVRSALEAPRGLRRPRTAAPLK